MILTNKHVKRDCQRTALGEYPPNARSRKTTVSQTITPKTRLIWSARGTGIVCEGAASNAKPKIMPTILPANEPVREQIPERLSHDLSPRNISTGIRYPFR